MKAFLIGGALGAFGLAFALWAYVVKKWPMR